MELNTQFDLDKYNIGVKDIKAETEKHLQAFNEMENVFPVEVFPTPFKELLNGCKSSLNFPTDYTGVAIISAVSTAIGKSAKAKVKNGWYEFSSLFIAIIGNAGANKSHPLELSFKPFQEIDKAMIDLFKEELEAFETFMAIPAKERGNGSKVNKPVLIKTILHNFTPEILCQRLVENERGCTVVSEELATFLEGMNNYSKGDQTSTYLSLWSNKPTSIDRVKSPVPLWLPQPFLNIIGSLQPRILPKLFPSGKTDNGFLQRFLFAYPSNAEKQPINDIEIDECLMQDYSNWITRYRISSPIFIDEETELPKAKVYYLSNDAKAFFYKWQKENTEQVNDNAESLKGEILSKFDIHFIRLSLILQIMTNYETNEISLQTVQGAAKLCIYFLNNAFKVLEMLGGQNKAHELPEDKKRLFDALPNEFSTGEGLIIAEKLGMPERTFKRFINDIDLFKWVKIGRYEKRK